MHPPRPRPKRTSDPRGHADRLVDWLLSHCPFCTLGVLTLIVLGPTLGPISDPMFIAVPIVVADVAFVIMRRLAAPHSTSLGAK
jgi:hypothetical protein